jgi:hypothetical protein
VKPAESSFELPRLSELEDPTLATAIADLRERKPDAAELASLASRLALQGIAVTAPVAATGAAARAAWKKWALLGGGAASGLAAWVALTTPDRSGLETPTHAPTATATASSTPSAARLGAEAVARATQAPSTLRSPTSSPPPAPSEVPVPATSELAAAPGVAPDAALSVPRSPVPHTNEERVAPPSPTSATARSRAGTNSPDTSPSLGPGGEVATAPSEIELLRDARLALKQSPSRALELTEAHARAFPHGKLTQERELIAISGLVALGRRTAALSRAHHFNEAFPESPYRKQIGELLR